MLNIIILFVYIDNILRLKSLEKELDIHNHQYNSQLKESFLFVIEKKKNHVNYHFKLIILS